VIYAAYGTLDATLIAWTVLCYVGLNLLALSLAVLGVAAVQRRTRPAAATVAVLAIVVCVCLFPVKRRWLDFEYTGGWVPLSQSLVMRPLAGAETADGEPMPGPPAIAYLG
jgi:hypothetical protein